MFPSAHRRTSFSCGNNYPVRIQREPVIIVSDFIDPGADPGCIFHIPTGLSLFRFSSAVRALDAWLGPGWEAAAEQTVARVVEQLDGFLSDEASCAAIFGQIQLDPAKRDLLFQLIGDTGQAVRQPALQAAGKLKLTGNAFGIGFGNGGGTIACYAGNVLGGVSKDKSIHIDWRLIMFDKKQINNMFARKGLNFNHNRTVVQAVQPKILVDRLEQGLRLPTGDSERFSGYGVMGLPFASGHVLGLRRFPASSIGPGYTSVWHRNPDGQWTFYQDVQPQHACTRYFGGAISETLEREIVITWSRAHSFTVIIRDEVNLRWQVSLTATPATRLINTLSGALPEGLWHNPTFLRKMGSVASLVLQAGHIDLTGVAPNGQTFVATPRKIWIIGSSTATLRGEDLDSIGPLQSQARLGDFWIPQRGIFAIGGAMFEPYNPSRHILKTSMQQSAEL